jgi:carboxymethylenebutenolidase
MDTLHAENVTLKIADGTTMSAYTAIPGDGGKLPGLLVFQEAFGVNEHIRDVTRRFAKAGFVAIAPELFHRTGPGFEGKYENFQACMPHMQALTPEGLSQDAQAAFDWLQKNPRVLPNCTASVGFCMGGRISFLANAVAPLQAAISFTAATSLRPYYHARLSFTGRCSSSGAAWTRTSRRTRFAP